ncbi:ABC transporter permease [Streptomyces sp. NPDC005438]|uniref:ABC transporter permease n=1 Tax=Streptomyces sp. NPDC005438 TaxID=3156880 RepID=UPI0033B436B7
MTPLKEIATDTQVILVGQIKQTLRSKIAIVFGLLQPVLFLVFFGPLLQDIPLGGRGDSWQTLVPGLLIQLGLFSSAFAGFGIIMEKQLGIVERLRVTPVSRLAMLLGRVLRDVLQLLVQSLLLLLVGVVMGLRAPVVGVAISLVFVAMLGVSLASLSYALGMRADTPQQFAPVVNSINLPAMLLSGVLLPMALAPGWLDLISHFVPFRYLVDGIRAAFVGDYGDGKVALAAVVALALCAVSTVLGTHLFRRAGA